jgi:large subunit ribosomal protein L30
MTAANKKPAAGRAQGASEKAGDRPIRATLMKSTIGALPQIKATVESLGFRRMNQTRDLPDNPAVRGMLKAVNFLVAVEGTPYIRPKRSQYKIWRSRSNKKHQRGK